MRMENFQRVVELECLVMMLNKQEFQQMCIVFTSFMLGLKHRLVVLHMCMCAFYVMTCRRIPPLAGMTWHSNTTLSYLTTWETLCIGTKLSAYLGYAYSRTQNIKFH